LALFFDTVIWSRVEESLGPQGFRAVVRRCEKHVALLFALFAGRARKAHETRTRPGFLKISENFRAAGLSASGPAQIRRRVPSMTTPRPTFPLKPPAAQNFELTVKNHWRGAIGYSA
jgi:hypothetical protein